jgi:hypothetical protein
MDSRFGRVSVEFDARVRIYSLRPTPMADLKRWLEETERLWDEQIAGLQIAREA